MLKPPLEPMLLSTKEKPFNSKDYLFELKWDGYRCITFVDDKKTILQSRNKNDLSKYFPELANIKQYIKVKNAVFDGEICYLNNKGKPVFSKLQGRLKIKNKSVIKNPVNLILWDLLSYNNKDIYSQPLIERKQILKEIIKDNKSILVPPYVIANGKELYEKADLEKLEGIVAKKIDSPYEFQRSKYWYKIKCWKYINTYIGGYSKNGNSLAVGMYDNKQLLYMGKVKISLSQEMNEALFRFFPRIISENCPFKNIPKNSDLCWLKPLIKTKVRYTELSRHNTFRHGFVVDIIYENSD